MPALTPPEVRESPLVPAWKIIKDAPEKPPCFRGTEWTSQARNKLEQNDRARAIRACIKDCDKRTLCAAWAFSITESWVWGGFTEEDRGQLKRTHPNLIGELIMRVKALVNTTDGRGGTLRYGSESDVPDRVGAMLVSKGYAEAIGVVEALDLALVGRIPDLPTPADVEIPLIDPDTMVDVTMGVDPPEDDGWPVQPSDKPSM